MENLIKIGLAILFFICLLNMPYGYFQLVRIAALIGFSVLAYEANQKGNQIEMVIYVCLLLLFQPFLKIALGRELWNIVDVIVGLGLLVSLVKKRRSEKNIQRI